MNNALLFLGGLLIAALTALFAVPHFVDWNSYRGLFEEEASRVLGRELRVGGAVNVRFLPIPYVRFEKVRIADQTDNGGGSIARVDSFMMWLAVPPLLKGVLEANKIELRRPVLQLATNDAGGGNWSSLSLNPGSLPFVPREVALQSVTIYDGAIIVTGPQRTELARFDAINGDLQVEALDGPVKFQGTLTWDDAPKAVRFSLGKRDQGGMFRVKAAVDSMSTGNTYVLDGRIGDLLERPTLEGDITANLRVQRTVTVAAKHLSAAGAAHSDSEPPSTSLVQEPDADQGKLNAEAASPASAFELKAKVKGNTAGIDLNDIAVALETDAAPQLVTGSAKLDWTHKLRLDIALASKWLDLDKVSGPDASSSVPLEAARGYFASLASILPQEADTSAKLEFDQLTLGGEPISDVRFAALRAGGPLELKGVRATLPGGARVELDGVLQPKDKVPKLDGELFLAGQSLHRFLAWGFKQADIGIGRTDGPFTLDGHFTLSENTIQLSDATAEWSGTALHGAIALDLGERKKLSLVVEGSRVDTAQIRSGLLSIKTFESLLSDPGASPGAPTHLIPGLDPAETDMSLRLKIGELKDGSRTLRDFDAEISVEKGALTLPLLKFSTDEGLRVEAEGDAADVPSKPHGTIRATVSAPSDKAARAFVELLDLSGDDATVAQRLTRLAPLRLASILSFAGDGQGSQLKVDGKAAGGRLSATVRLDRRVNVWRDAPFELSVAMVDVESEQVLTSLFGLPPSSAASGAFGKGSLTLKAAGTPASGLISLAELTADGLSLDYHGRVSLPVEEGLAAIGDLRLNARDGRSLLALAGVPIGEGAAGAPVSGSLSLTLKDRVLRLESSDFSVDANTFKGVVALAPGDTGKPNITASIETPTLSMATLLSPILRRQEPPPEVTPPPPAQRTKRRAQEPAPPPTLKPIWPDQTFDLATLDHVTGTIKAKIGALVLEPGLTVSNVTLDAKLDDRTLSIERFDGTALGGKLTSKMDIEKASAGIGLNGNLRIDLASKPAPPGEPGDLVAFGIDFSGRALSPTALLSSLSGKGEVAVGDVTISGMSPSAISAVVEAGLQGKGPIGGEALSQAIKQTIRQGELKLGKIAIPLTIADGSLELEKVKVDAPDGRSTFQTVLELTTMKLDSEWQIEIKLARSSGPPERAYLPPVSVVYVGKLTDYATLTPDINVSALERELAVRKLERDAEQLEILRKADQARAQAERERRQEIERQRTQPVPPNAQGAPGGDQPQATSNPAPGASAAPPAPTNASPVGNAQATAPPAGSSVGTVGAASSEATTATTASEQPELAAGATAPPAEPAARPVRRRPKPVEEKWQPFYGGP